MMDAGPTPEILLYNMYAMEMKLQNVDIVALCHGHYDHTGGLIEVLKQIKKRVPVIAHPTVFVPRLKIKPLLKFIGESFTCSRVESVGGTYFSR